MKRRFWLYIVVLITGIIIVLLPDDNNRVISLNKFHGPSIADITGVILIIFVWLAMLLESLFQYKKILTYLKLKGIFFSLFFIIAGSIWIAFSLNKNANQEWIPGAFFAVAGYVFPFYAVFKK